MIQDTIRDESAWTEYALFTHMLLSHHIKHRKLTANGFRYIFLNEGACHKAYKFNANGKMVSSRRRTDSGVEIIHAQGIMRG